METSLKSPCRFGPKSSEPTVAIPLCDGHVHLEASLRRRGRRAGADAGAEFEEVLLDCARDLVDGGAQFALLRFNPLSWRQRGLPLDRQAAHLRAAAEKAHSTWAIVLRWFVTLKREGNREDLTAAVEAASAARDMGVLGVDVSRSYEVGRGIPPFDNGDGRALAQAVARARGNGLAVAVHCGWHDGRRELEEALEWGATRIGHATPLAAADDLLADVAAAQVTVEVCPTAFERQTERGLFELPVGEWLAAGLRVDVGTDHPLALGTDLRIEARELSSAFPAWPEIALRVAPLL